MIIAVDGPSASGKGTLARAVARALGYHYLDTGAIYRMVGLSMLRAGKPATDTASAVAFAEGLDPASFEDRDLRNETVGAMTSQVSAIPEVRAALLEFQRAFARKSPGAVLDGRDIGTVVCPDADLKFFVTASPEVRAMRRHLELQNLGFRQDLEAVLADVMARDERDSTRAIAPTLAAADAIVIDTSSLTREQALEAVMASVRQRQAGH